VNQERVLEYTLKALAREAEASEPTEVDTNFYAHLALLIQELEIACQKEKDNNKISEVLNAISLLARKAFSVIAKMRFSKLLYAATEGKIPVAILPEEEGILGNLLAAGKCMEIIRQGIEGGSPLTLLIVREGMGSRYPGQVALLVTSPQENEGLEPDDVISLSLGAAKRLILNNEARRVIVAG